LLSNQKSLQVYSGLAFPEDKLLDITQDSSISFEDEELLLHCTISSYFVPR